MGSKKKKTSAIGEPKEATISDPRFSNLHSDPRFQKLPKHKSKVVIDDRFSRLFTDKRFAGSSAPLDKRGKAKKQSENALSRYYRQGEEGDDEGNKKLKEKVKVVETKDSESESSESEAESESESEADAGVESDASTSTADDTDDDADILEDDDSVEVENVPVIEKETHRLAVVNMDWNHVKAVDLFMMLTSFLPKGGQIKSVSVYPSEFGLQRMKEEEVRGPAALFDDENKDDDDDGGDDDEIDPEKLREYEKSRLRYYYAVVECDSVATADYLYKACDGVEFERSSNVMDLRFIPDSMEFKHPARDISTEASTDYDGLDFQTRALQHSDVLLSWDDDEPHRVKTMRRKFSDKQLADLELKEFLASDESESDDEENDCNASSIKKKNKLEMYRSLVQSGDGSEDEDDDGQEMEVTFNTGLEDLSSKILEKKDRGAETVWEAYLRKKSEKRKARKSKSKNSSDDESDESDASDEEAPEQPDDFFEEEPRTKKADHSKKNKDERDKALEASRAELELLLADETGEADKKVKGYNIKQKKGKKGKDVPDEDKIPTIDHDDPRFSNLFSNPAFALDPTDPQFKRSAPYFRQLAQKQQKGREDEGEDGQLMEVTRATCNNSVEKEEELAEVDRSQREKHELSSIVKSLKMKSQQRPTPSRVTTKDKTGSNGSTVKEKKHKLPSLDRPKKKKAKV